MKKRSFYLILLMVVVGFLSFLLIRQNTDGDIRKDSVYSSLAELNGFDLNSIKGEYFILHFWAKWCEPCADEIPHLLEFARAAKLNRPLKVLAVSLDPSLDEARHILPEGGANLPSNFLLALDPEHRVAQKIGSYQYPESYFVGPQGEIIEKWVGAQKWQKLEVLEFFRQRVR
jgi:thiol-disulfide isomerase/thioredoxin